jgi:putative redox protein
MYAARKEISFDTLHVSTRLERSKEGNVFFRTIAIEPPVSADEQASLLRIAEKCPVHKTLENSNTINTIFL